MSVSSTKTQIDSSIKQTILEAEKMLKYLAATSAPKDVTRRSQKKTTTCTTVSWQEKSCKLKEGKCCGKPAKCENKATFDVVPGSLNCIPLYDVTGCVINLSVSINGPNPRVIPMILECPGFVPKRIKFDGIWRNIE